MNTKSEIEIIQVANGYVVKPATNQTNIGNVIHSNDLFVFTSFDGLCEFLANHFEVDSSR